MLETIRCSTFIYNDAELLDNNQMSQTVPMYLYIDTHIVYLVLTKGALITTMLQ